MDQREYNLDERCYPELNSRRVVEDHSVAYMFAKDLISGRVLDIACGEGYGSEILKKSSAAEIIGADIDDNVIQRAQIKYPEVTFVTANATHTGFPDEYFDTVVSFQTWHHLSEYDKFIPEMARILKPQGIFIVSVPNEKVIYLNPFHRQFLTSFYKVNFTRKTAEAYLKKNFPTIQWYGQRFISRFYINPPIKLLLFFVSLLGEMPRKKIHALFALAGGSQIKPLKYDNARYLIAVCRKHG